MIYIGVDPGKHGAIAGIDVAVPQVTGAKIEPRVEVIPMPLVKAAKGRDEYDVPRIVYVLETLRACSADGHVAAFVERLHPMPPGVMGGASANFHRGLGHGLWVGILTALQIPFTLVLAKAWQKVMLEGTSGDDTKQRSLVAAQRLFPNVSLLPTERSRKPSDGMSDALLIAKWGADRR